MKYMYVMFPDSGNYRKYPIINNQVIIRGRLLTLEEAREVFTEVTIDDTKPLLVGIL